MSLAERHGMGKGLGKQRTLVIEQVKADQGAAPGRAQAQAVVRPMQRARARAAVERGWQRLCAAPCRKTAEGGRGPSCCRACCISHHAPCHAELCVVTIRMPQPAVQDHELEPHEYGPKKGNTAQGDPQQPWGAHCARRPGGSWRRRHQRRCWLGRHRSARAASPLAALSGPAVHCRYSSAQADCTQRRTHARSWAGPPNRPMQMAELAAVAPMWCSRGCRCRMDSMAPATVPMPAVLGRCIDSEYKLCNGSYDCPSTECEAGRTSSEGLSQQPLLPACSERTPGAFPRHAPASLCSVLAVHQPSACSKLLSTHDSSRSEVHMVFPALHSEQGVGSLYAELRCISTLRAIFFASISPLWAAQTLPTLPSTPAQR